MKLGSLFSGYGGLDLAVESVLGTETAWVSDIDPGAVKILAHRFPGVPNLGDVTEVDWSAVEPVDIITGGFPCQDISVAGKQAGLIRYGEHSNRSGLWAEMCRAIDNLRPALVLAENVRALTSVKADSEMEPCPWCLGDGSSVPLRALGAVLGDLADIGYDAVWCGLPASDVGAPHGRFRIFILAWRRQAPDTSSQRRDEGQSEPARIERRSDADQRDSSAAPDDDGELLRIEPVAEPGSSGPAITRVAGAEPPSDAGRPGREGDRHGSGQDAAGRVRQIGAPAAAPECDLDSPADPGSWEREGRPGLRPASDDAREGLRRLRPGYGRRDAADPAGEGRTERPGPGSSSDIAEADGRRTTEPRRRGRSTANPSGVGRDGWSGGLRTGGDARERIEAGGHPGDRGGSVAPDSDGEGLGLVGNGDGSDPDGRSGSHTEWGPYRPAIQRWEALTRPAPPATEPGRRGGQRLSPRLSEWMMGLPDGWITDVPGIGRTGALKAAGNGVVPQQAAEALRFLLERAEAAMVA